MITPVPTTCDIELTATAENPVADNADDYKA